MELCGICCPFISIWKGKVKVHGFSVPGRNGTANEGTLWPINGAFNPIIVLLFVCYTHATHPHDTLELALSSSFIRWGN